MSPLLCIFLVSTLVSVKSQVYVPAPTSQLFYPTAQQNTPQEEPSNNVKQEQEILDDPYATMEIFRQAFKGSEGLKSTQLPVEPRENTEITVESSERQVQVNSQGQSIIPQDYFTLLGGKVPNDAEKNEDYSKLFATPAPLEATQPGNLQTADTQVFPAESYGFGDAFSSGFTKVGETQGKPTRFYPVQSGYSPISDFSSTGSFSKNENVKQIEEIVDDAVVPKPLKPKKKYSSKLKKFPKKYRPSPKKLRNKPKLNPAAELLDEFSLDTMKNKRKIPFNHGGNSFSSDYENFEGGKDEGDFSANSGSGFGGSSAPYRTSSRSKTPYSTPPSYASPSSAPYKSLPSDSSEYSGSYRTPGDSSGYDGSSSPYKTSGFDNPSASYKGPSSDSSDFSGSSGFEGPSAALTGGSGGGFVGSSAAFHAPSGSNDGERMQFQMFGMNGPHSYKFGYDTGKGHNRHFRFEERDNHGKVKGHYGFYDQEGKMSMMHYEADPHTGYKAGPYHHPENHHDFDYNHQK